MKRNEYSHLNKTQCGHHSNKNNSKLWTQICCSVQVMDKSLDRVEKCYQKYTHLNRNEKKVI